MLVAHAYQHIISGPLEVIFQWSGQTENELAMYMHIV